MFTLKFDTDNAAFEDDPKTEIARTMREVADKIEAGSIQDYIRDINGNTIGQFAFNPFA